MGSTFVRDKKVEETFGFCLFGVGDNDFNSRKEVNDAGEPYKCCYLEKSYLDPYKRKILDVEDYLILNNNEKMKLIYITHPELFIPSVVDGLKKLGFTDDEIFYGPVVYIDKHKSKIAETFPRSLFYKDKKFESENEIRVIVYSTRKQQLDKFKDRDYCIEIGGIQQYATIIDFPYEDIQIRKENGRIIFDTPNRFYITNSIKTWVELCKMVIFLAKQGIWINKRQHDELEIIKRILWKKHGIFVRIQFSESTEFVTEFINANPKRSDNEFKHVIQSIWDETQ